MPTELRCSGVLLHPSSLPGPHGIGDLGAGARHFIDFLALSGQSLWQILPLGPVGADGCPYSALSAMAGNPLLLSLEDLLPHGLLFTDELASLPNQAAPYMDLHLAAHCKLPLLRRALSRLRGGLRQEFYAFCHVERHWLDDYVLFASLNHEQASPWYEWSPELRDREPMAMAEARRRLQDERRFHAFCQFIFQRQWQALRRYAREKGVEIVGDMPIYVGLNSADVWAHRHLFCLDECGQPSMVAGAAPDRFFDERGQRWGNPVYDWAAMADDGYQWWVDRVAQLLRLVDQVRIDHFRGFESFWALPAQELDARRSYWLPGPGQALFNALREHFPDLPLLVEDLGFITPEVEQLRDDNQLPGMAVLQFAFGSRERATPYYPHLIRENQLVYTGTHDTETTLAWYQSLSPERRQELDAYPVAYGITPIQWRLIQMAWQSPARYAITPMQDLLGLGTEGRMNRPGEVNEYNWRWRLTDADFPGELSKKLRTLGETCGRLVTPVTVRHPVADTHG